MNQQENKKYKCLKCGKETEVLYAAIGEKWQCAECYHKVSDKEATE